MNLGNIYESIYEDQWKNYDPVEDLGREISHQEEFRWINERALSKLVLLFIEKPWLSFREFWNLTKDKINAVLKNYKSPTITKKEFLQWILFEGIDNLFQNHLEIKPEFNNLLRKDSNYHIYFHILERDFISISSNLKNINFNKIRGKCLYYPEIEEPDVKVPKIIVQFPTEDFDFVLDTLENFLDEHQALIHHRYEKRMSEFLLEQFKRTTFIFERNRE